MDSAFEIATINRSRINEIIDWINQQSEDAVPNDIVQKWCCTCYFANREGYKPPCNVCNNNRDCFAPMFIDTHLQQ